MATAEQTLEIARAQIGTTENPPNSNCQKYSHDLSRPCEPWCADSVVWILRQAGVHIPSESAYTPYMYNGFVKAGTAVKDLAHGLKPGDVIFFDFKAPFTTTGIQHVGFFVSYAENGYINTLEGNTSSGDGGSQDNGGGYYARKRSLQFIVGAGRPPYEANPAPVSEELHNADTPSGVVGSSHPIVTLLSAADGYWVVTDDGAIFSFNVPFHGGLGGVAINSPIVGGATTPDGGGYWLVAADGGIFGFGNAAFHGSLGGVHLNAPIVGMTATPDGGGYWLVGADGGIFGFGNAAFHGSAGGVQLAQPVVGIASTPSGGGYWLVARDGGVFAFGDAGFHGSTGGIRLSKDIVGLNGTPSGQGYWLVGADGGVFSFGDAGFFGSAGNITLAAPVVSIKKTPTGQGYWLVARDGGIFAFGDAAFHGAVHYGG